MKLVTVNQHELHMTVLTLITLSKSLGQTSKGEVSQWWAKKCCELESSWTTEGISAKTKLTQILLIVGPQTECVFKVTDARVKVTETISGKGLPSHSSPSTSI